MKKAIAITLLISMVLSSVACGSGTTTSDAGIASVQQKWMGDHQKQMRSLKKRLRKRKLASAWQPL